MRQIATLVLACILLTGYSKAQDLQNRANTSTILIRPMKHSPLNTWPTSAPYHMERAPGKWKREGMEVVNAITDTRFNIAGMPPFKGDRTLKDTTVAYIKILFNVFNEDYGKIVNMEEIAEQSYDAMEAYLLAQEKAQEKLEQASEKQNQVQKRSAAAHNVTLVETETTVSNKMKIAAEVENHYHEVYLVFFKCYKQEAYLMDAIEKKNLLSIEQNLNSLQKFIKEGNEKLDGMTGYNKDISLIQARRQALAFYQTESDNSSAITDFFLKGENFIKTKKLFDSKPAACRTQADIDQYNKAVNEMNEAVNKYNALNTDLNKQRTKAIDSWNNTAKHFMDNYVPVQRG